MISILKPAPFIKTWRSTRLMMVIVTSLLYLLIFPYLFLSGNQQYMISYVTLTGLMLAFELIMSIVHRRLYFLDGSTLVTATLLFLLLPPTISASMAIQLAFFAIVIAKWSLGGLGFSYINPTIFAFFYFVLVTPSLEPIYLNASLEPSLLSMVTHYWGYAVLFIVLLSMMCALAISRIIDWVIVITFLISYISGIYLLQILNINSLENSLFLSLDWLFVAIFIIPNPSNLPSTWLGRVVYAVLIAALWLLMAIKPRWSVLAMPMAILIINILSPIINYYTLGKTFAGREKKRI